MKLTDRSIVITGAASGIGRALAVRFAAERPRGIVLADLPRQAAALEELAAALARDGAGAGAAVPALAVPCDVAAEAQVRSLVAAAEARFGQVDVFFSNAGLIRDGDENSPDAEWNLNWQVHVMAHLYAARAALPGMIRRGEGYLLSTASAAGLITSLPSATYAVSKHAAIALAEWLSITHGAQGVRVSVLCPQAVDTPMIRDRAGSSAARADGVLGAEQVAQSVVEAIDAETFLILPHAEVIEYFRRKAGDYDRWLGGMRKFAARLKAPRNDG